MTDTDTDVSAVEQSTSVSLDFGHELTRADPIRWFCIAADRPAILGIDEDVNDLRVMTVRFHPNAGGIADVAELALPLHDLTEFVHRVRERDLNLDGFVDALDGRPARGFSTHYLDQYSLGQVEARERAL